MMNANAESLRRIPFWWWFAYSLRKLAKFGGADLLLYLLPVSILIGEIAIFGRYHFAFFLSRTGLMDAFLDFYEPVIPVIIPFFYWIGELVN
jgi:hypothetical protein